MIIQNNKKRVKKPKLLENKELKNLIIRTKNDYISRNTNSPKKILLKKEEEIYKEIEKRIKKQVDKKMKEIERGMSRQIQYIIDDDNKRLGKEERLIEKEKKTFEKYHKEQALRRDKEQEEMKKKEEDIKKYY